MDKFRWLDTNLFHSTLMIYFNIRQLSISHNAIFCIDDGEDAKKFHSHKRIKVDEITMFNVAQYTYFWVSISMRRYPQDINLLAWISLLYWLTISVGSAFSVLLWWWILCLLLVHKTYFNNLQSIISISLDPNFLPFCMFPNNSPSL